MKTLNIAAAATMLAVPAFAEGDAAAGAEQFDRQCVSCHVITDDGGNVLAGRSARTGPNLYGIVGKAPGTAEGYRYGNSIVEYGETGAAWSEETLVSYITEPTGFLREALDNNRARGKMAYKVRDAQQAADISAYLATFSE